MKTINILLGLLFVSWSSQSFAFFGAGDADVGAAGAGKSCKAPEFSKFAPAHLSVVQPESGFSFLASRGTNPKTIKVTAKKKAVEISVEEVEHGLIVTGKLPGSLADTYARIQIHGSSVIGCPGQAGWLVRIDKHATAGHSGEVAEAE